MLFDFKTQFYNQNVRKYISHRYLKITAMIRIILTDYHQIIREGLKLILKDASDFIVVAEAQTGIQVSQKIQNTACDILLLDMDIPGNNSVELLNDLKKIKPTLPILALSINPEDKHALRILKAEHQAIYARIRLSMIW